MATLASLKLVAAKKPSNLPPVVHRRNKLSSKVYEQIQLARSQNEGTVFAPTRTKTVTNAEGQRVQLTQPRRVKPWWFVAESGKCCIAIRYGSKVLELAKGKTAIEVASASALIDALEAVNAAVIAGELDGQIEAASGQLRSAFVK
jgi:transposase